jgi:RNA polymerase sigma-70 factor, ECF subfamily
MPRSRHVSVDLSRRARERDRLDHAALSDPILVARARSGDARALSVLVERHAALVERTAKRLLPDVEDAHDAAQEALARLVSGIGSYRGQAAFTTWLTQIVRNACADHGRSAARRRRSEVAETVALRAVDRQRMACDEPSEGVTSAAPLRRGLAGLTDPQRRAVILKDVLQLRYEDVAAVMALPVGTVKSHTHRGRKRLAARLRRSA